MHDVEHVLDALDFFTVHTNITGGKHEYLLRPDLGLQLSDAAKQTMHAQCTPSPNI
jgi:ethanolamine ammonia-lyase small subunit